MESRQTKLKLRTLINAAKRFNAVPLFTIDTKMCTKGVALKTKHNIINVIMVTLLQSVASLSPNPNIFHLHSSLLCQVNVTCMTSLSLQMLDMESLPLISHITMYIATLWTLSFILPHYTSYFMTAALT